MILAIFVMLMNYFHDLATGLMFGSVLAYFLAVRIARRALEGSQQEEVGARLWSTFRPVVLGTLAAVVLGGIPRMIFYYDYEWLPAAGRGQVVALILKHVLLVSITVFSITAFLKNRPGEAVSRRRN